MLLYFFKFLNVIIEIKLKFQSLCLSYTFDFLQMWAGVIEKGGRGEADPDWTTLDQSQNGNCRWAPVLWKLGNVHCWATRLVIYLFCLFLNAIKVGNNKVWMESFINLFKPFDPTYSCSGLPNVGKSTFFNVLTKTSMAAAENFPFCTIDPNESRLL